MSKRKNLTYRAAGVNIDAGDEMVERIRSAVHMTYGPRVQPSHGGFAGLFRLDYDERLFKKNYREPLLVACTDGVGSKLLVASQLNRYDTVGIDLVAMSVNDMLTVGAEPLFFLDYIAVPRLDPRHVAQIVEGVAKGCRESDCALLGGETAELPELYAPGHFDLAGFGVGVVERKKVINGKRIEPGDVILGLESSGIHSNGYALARKIMFDVAGHKPEDRLPKSDDTIGDALLRPTRIYVKSVHAVLSGYRRKQVVTGMAHITGGGLPGNIPRILPAGLDAVVRTKAWKTPAIFRYLQSHGVAKQEMFRVFNMGIGYVMVVRPTFAAAVTERLTRCGERVHAIGEIREGNGQFVFE